MLIPHDFYFRSKNIFLFPDCTSSCSAGEYLSGSCSGTGTSDTVTCEGQYKLKGFVFLKKKIE